MNNRIKTAIFVIFISAAFAVFSGCGQGAGEPVSGTPSTADTPPSTPVAAPPSAAISTPSAAPSESAAPEESEPAQEMIPPTAEPAMFEVLMPEAPGTDVNANDKVTVDFSNAREGYIMIKSAPGLPDPVVRIKGPSGVTYQYLLRNDGEYAVFPLSDGNGEYSVIVGEKKGTGYATANSAKIAVELNDEFAPFIRPNQFVNYTPDSKVVKKAAELIAGESDSLQQIAIIYDYVINTLSYDDQLAAAILSGQVTSYIPDVDAVLESGKGICFDYAALMTAMLRSHGMPTKLVIGYAGTVYHAWINIYSDKTGWIENVVYFDGESWKIMDPTYASGGADPSLIGDGSNYEAMFLY